MRLELKMMQLHEPLFIAGANLGNKLTPKSSKGDIVLIYDTDLKSGLVEYKGEVAIIPNVASATVCLPSQLGFEQERKPLSKEAAQLLTDSFPTNPHARAQVSGPEKPVKNFTAQVSDPTRDMVRRRPGPKPKFQGEEN